MWCWRRLLRVPWTARRSNQSILKEISPGFSLERLMLTLKLQYFGHLMRRADSFEKDPDAGKDWGQEKKETTKDEMVGWHHRLTGHGFGWTPGVGDGQGGLACCSSWGRKASDTTERLNWTELTFSASGINAFFTGGKDPGTNKGLAAVTMCWESLFVATSEIDVSITTKAERTVQSNSETIDSPKPITGHCCPSERWDTPPPTRTQAKVPPNRKPSVQSLSHVWLIVTP